LRAEFRTATSSKFDELTTNEGGKYNCLSTLQVILAKIQGTQQDSYPWPSIVLHKVNLNTWLFLMFVAAM
jgi:hypothetical protein